MRRDNYIVPQTEMLEEHLFCQILQDSDYVDGTGERNPYYPGDEFEW